jgi:hypothetical protein
MTDRAGRAGSNLWVLVIGWALISLAALVWSLAGMEIDRARTVAAGEHNLRSLWPYWIACASLWSALSAMWLALARSRDNAASSFGRTVILVLLVAIGVRAAVLLTHDPALSDDVNRYIFDGRNLAVGKNPYLVMPADRLMASEERWPGEQQLLPLITYPELATPYLPVSQLVFATIGKCIGVSWSDPVSSARVFRVAFVALEIALMSLLTAALWRTGRSAWWLALYAWHPLPISEIAGSGHQDIIGIVFLVASLLAFTIAPAKTWRWSVLLALSAMGKPFTLPAGAMILRGRTWREWMNSLAIGATVAVLALAPFWFFWGDHGAAYHHWRATADVLAEKFAHFGGVYEPVLGAVRTIMPADGQPVGYNLKQEWLARKICFGVLAVIGVGIFFSRLNAWQATRAFLFALVMLTTTAHPWYLLWAFALIPLAPSPALWIASLTLPWGYVVIADGVSWKVSAWVYAAAYIPVFAALLVDVVLSWRRRTAMIPPSIPTPS